MRRGYAIQPMDSPAVTVVVPTAGRAAYLEVTLDSLRRQRTETPHEILVIDDGAADATPEVAERFGARLVRHGERRNLNVARNTGVREARADLVAFLDDDVFVPPGWLDALVEGAARHPTLRPSAARSGRASRATPRGAAAARIPRSLRWTSATRTWRRRWSGARTSRCAARPSSGSAQFDETRDRLHGDEEDWLLRLRAAGGRIVYLAGAGLYHRRDADDSTLRALSRVAFERGRAARETDLRRGSAPGLARELRVLVGCGWHTLRRACPQGVVMGANSAGRVVETLRPR